MAGTTTLVIARTDANAADLLTSDCDPYDADFIVGERTAEGFYRVRAGIDQAIARGLAYSPYADLVWCETAKPDLEEARKFAEAIHAQYPDQLLAYNCSPSFNWEKNTDAETIAKFQQELADIGYKYQFITLAVFTTCGSTCSNWRTLTRRVKACATTWKWFSVVNSRQQKRLHLRGPPTRSGHRLL